MNNPFEILEKKLDNIEKLLLENSNSKAVTNTSTPEEELLTRDQVCELLGIGKTTLHNHTKSGKLQSFGIGNRVLYKRSQILEAVTPINH